MPRAVRVVASQSSRGSIVPKEHRLPFLFDDTVEAMIDQQAKTSVDIILPQPSYTLQKTLSSFLEVSTDWE